MGNKSSQSTLGKKRVVIRIVKIMINSIRIFFFFFSYAKSDNNCKGTIWFLRPKGNKILVQKAQYNEFVESRLENYALISWITTIVDPRWWESKEKLVSSKENRHRHNPRRLVLVFLLNLITSLVPVVTIFFLNSPILSPWGFSLYHIPLSSSSPSSMIDQKRINTLW